MLARLLEVAARARPSFGWLESAPDDVPGNLGGIGEIE